MFQLKIHISWLFHVSRINPFPHLNIQGRQKIICINPMMKTRNRYGSPMGFWYMWGKVLEKEKATEVSSLQWSAVESVSVSCCSCGDSIPLGWVLLCIIPLSWVETLSVQWLWVQSVSLSLSLLVTLLGCLSLDSSASLHWGWWCCVVSLVSHGINTAKSGIWSDPIRLPCIVPWSTSFTVRLRLSSLDRF